MGITPVDIELATTRAWVVPSLFPVPSSSKLNERRTTTSDEAAATNTKDKVSVDWPVIETPALSAEVGKTKTVQ